MSGTGDNLVLEKIFGNQAADNKDEPKKPEQENIQARQGEPGEDGKEKERKKLLAGKFKTVEELEKAYEEVQKWGTQRSQEAAALRRQLEELRKEAVPDMTAKQREEWRKHVQQAINAAVVDENPEPLIQLIDYMAEKRAESKVQEKFQDIAPLVQKQRFQNEVNAFLHENPEAVEHIADMVKILEDEPAIVTQANWLDKLFARVLKQKFASARKAGAEKAAKAEAEKEAAAMPGGKPRQEQKSKTPEDEILDAIFTNRTPGGILG